MEHVYVYIIQYMQMSAYVYLCRENMAESITFPLDMFLGVRHNRRVS